MISVDGVTNLVVLIDFVVQVADSLFCDFVLCWACFPRAMQMQRGDCCNESTVEGNWRELSSSLGE